MYRMAQTMETPPLFGLFHFAASVLAVCLALIYHRVLRGYAIKKTLFVTGLVLLVTEVWKQLFVYYVINGGTYYNWWYFPFQLCSIPMWLCLYSRFTDDDSVYGFLATYGVIGALMALAYPEDMLREYVYLTMHGFLWHGLILGAGLLAAEEVHRMHSFRGTLRLFAVLCIIAETVNTAGHLLRQGGSEPDMFYISPFVPAGQPLFSLIGSALGRGAEIIIYLGVLSTGAWLLYRAEKKSDTQSNS